jgi:hypothetical protein
MFRSSSKQKGARVGVGRLVAEEEAVMDEEGETDAV